MNQRLLHSLLLAAILLVAAAFRFYGQAWDEGYLLHPDERQIVLVASRLQWPANLLEALSPESPLSPKFFAYGSFPIYLLRGLSFFAPAVEYAVPGRQDSFVALGMLGRTLSALFDLGVIALVFLLGRRLYSAAIGLAAAALTAVTVLDIQLAHFYAVDTLMTFFVLATVLFAARFGQSGRRWDAIGMGVCFGLALATKVTSLPLIVPVVVAILHAGAREAGVARTAKQHDKGSLARLKRSVSSFLVDLWSVRRTLALVALVAAGVFVITQPYAMLDPVRYFGQVGTEMLVARGWLDFPYTRQYVDTPPFIYQIAQSSVWGMGLPLGLFAWLGSGLFVWQWIQQREWREGLLLSWALVLFLSIGGQHAKYLRYLLPLLPFLYLIAAAATANLLERVERRSASFVVAGLAFAVFAASLLYALAFSSLYTRRHPWLQVSEWIYKNVAPGATIAVEHWDDQLPLPMRVDGTERNPSEYNIQSVPMYDPDDAEKVQILAERVAESDYVILASQRLYTTIPRLPARYPISSRYYHQLLTGELGFELADSERNDMHLGPVLIENDVFGRAGLTAPLGLPLPSPGTMAWNWGHADESFTVYDHPMPLVFRSVGRLSSAQIQGLLTNP